MAFGTQDDSDEVMNEINMTPLVDVMLVLLIIFIITVPVLQHAVNVELPQATNQRQPELPQAVRLSVDAQGTYYWNEAAIPDAELPRLLARAAAQQPQPQLQIRGDRSVRYERVAQALAEAQRSGLRQIGFITEPRER